MVSVGKINFMKKNAHTFRLPKSGDFRKKLRLIIRVYVTFVNFDLLLLLNDKIYNTDRSLGAMFSGHLAKNFGHEGLKEDSIKINLV